MYLKAIIAASALFACVTSSFAIPTLQLDIPGGAYNNSDQTTYSGSTQFTLVALLDGTLDVNRTYYISAAIEPRIDLSGPPPAFGSFTLAGQTFDANNMHAGAPPLGASKTISPHDVYPSYFTEFEFHFDAAHTTGEYDVQDGTTGPGTMYTFSLAVDTSALAQGYSVHFDLYNIAATANGKDFAIDDVAPFSHDANSGTNPPPPTVPDGGTTLVLFGVALIAVAWIPRMQLVRARSRRR